jgi:Tfp pilus assembly protein PilF
MLPKAIICVLCAFFILNCSTAPKQQETVTAKKNQAAEYTSYGNDYFTQGIYDKALQFFDLALWHNMAVDNEQGMARSYNSIGNV